MALSKFVFLAQVLPIPNEITTTIQRIQREFLWNSSNVKIKHETICNDFQNGGLKNVDIPSKISSLQCSWVKKLYDQNSHDWKLIPMHFINNAFGKNFIFHSNFSFKTSVLHQFPTFYANIIQSWKRNFSHTSYTTRDIGSQFLWVNNYITTDFREFLKNFRVTILTLKTGITLKENFNSPLINVTNLHKFHAQFLKNRSKY